MENLREPVLIRPSRTLKTTSKNNFCFKSLSTMGASTWFLCVTFYVHLQSLCQHFYKKFVIFAQTLQIYIKNHTQKSCAGGHSRQRL